MRILQSWDATTHLSRASGDQGLEQKMAQDTIQAAIAGRNFSHTSYVREYISRKIDGVVRPYSGRFGTGVMVLRPNNGSSRYSFVDYYLD